MRLGDYIAKRRLELDKMATEFETDPDLVMADLDDEDWIDQELAWISVQTQ